MSWLSQHQVDALLSLRRGWPFGIDHRTERSLVRRGMIEVRPTAMRSGDVFVLPHLTGAGRVAAWVLDQSQREQAGARPSRGGLQVIDGGLA